MLTKHNQLAQATNILTIIIKDTLELRVGKFFKHKNLDGRL
jgi:hypothetical protein